MSNEGFDPSWVESLPVRRLSLFYDWAEDTQRELEKLRRR